MLLPRFTHGELTRFVWANLGALAILWVLQMAKIHWVALSLRTLFIISIIAVLMDYGPLVVKQASNARTVDHIRLDLNVTFSAYGLLYLLTPRAFSPRNPAESLALLGFLFSVGALVLAYVPRNHYVGIRFPQTYASPVVWRKTNLLGARLGFICGVIFFLAAGLFGADVGTAALLLGVIGLVIGTWTYANRLFQRGK